MIISGLQKMTLLDYPGKVGCTVFLSGCNFRCPFCHNSGLLDRNGEALMTDRELLAFLEKRRGLLEGVCVTGGEPTLEPELPALLRSVRDLGFAVKLDTNGARPEVLERLLEENLLDYVAMDIKNCPERYGETVGVPGLDLEKIARSARLLLTQGVDYEFRTTVVREFHDEAAMASMGKWLASLAENRKPKRLFLQAFVDRESVLLPGLHPADRAEMTRFQEILTPYIGEVRLRGLP